MKKQISPEQIAEYKQKHGEIFQIDVINENNNNDELSEEIVPEDKKETDTFGGIFKRPGRKVLSLASRIGDKDPVKFNEVIAKNCFVDGDEEILNDDILFLSISSQLVKLIKVQESRIKKL